MIICGIYKITNKINGKMYVGQSVNIKKRWNSHINDDRKKNQYAIHMAIKKYGKENFSFEVIEQCLPTELNEREIYWISYYDTYNNGYNLTMGGDNATRYNYEQIYLLWKSGKQCKEIEDIIGCSDKVVTQALHAFEVTEEEIRSRSNINPGKPVVAIDINTLTPLRVFNSALEANLFLCSSGRNNSIITTTIKHRKDNWTLYGYYWEYANENNRPTKELTDEEFLAHRVNKRAIISSETIEKLSLAQRTIERPTRDELKEMIRTIPFTTIGKNYHVSDNAIRKWCDFYHLPRKVKDIKQYSDEEWANL